MKKILKFLLVFMVITSCKDNNSYDLDEVAIVNDIFRTVLDDGALVSENDIKIVLDNYLRSLKTEDLSNIKASDLYLGYDVEKEKENAQLDVGQITNVGNYDIVASEPEKGKSAKVHFSRVYFNQSKEKGILIFEIFCGEYCYEKKIITVKKDVGSGKWTIIDTNTLEVA